MYKLLIVDDEPLVQVGIKSMLNWSEHDIEICGTALNGQQALEIMEQQQPQIVISDIKMPVMDGLELLKHCREKYGSLPIFIILTSYEEFDLAKQAINLRANDYLIKLELNRTNLVEAIEKAIEDLEELLPPDKPQDQTAVAMDSPYFFHEKFFVSLINNMFISDEQYYMLQKELNIQLEADKYILCYCELQGSHFDESTWEQLVNLHTSTLNMVHSITNKYTTCYEMTLDVKHFCLLFCFKDAEAEYSKELLLDILNTTFEMIFNYFNVRISCSVGKPCDIPLKVSESYQSARQAFQYTSPENAICFFEDHQENNANKNLFNISLFKDDLKTAFGEYDKEILYKVLTDIINLFQAHASNYLQALDAATNILYLANTMLPQGEDVVNQIFSEIPFGYRSLYKRTNMDELIDWMYILRDGLCSYFDDKTKSHKNHIVANIKRYIHANITEKLTLNTISSIFGISPNYLSLLFKKNNDIGFSEYVTKMKVEKAKEMLENEKHKVYEVAYILGFENAFYFSKVFKKVTGQSPTEYLQYVHNQKG